MMARRPPDDDDVYVQMPVRDAMRGAAVGSIWYVLPCRCPKHPGSSSMAPLHTPRNTHSPFHGAMAHTLPLKAALASAQ